MSLGNVMLFWFEQLHKRKVFHGSAMLELGPSTVLATPAVCSGFMERTLGTNPEGRVTAQQAYAAVGLSDYESVDLGDTSATHLANLNEPLALERRLDAVAEFGTFEHIFNLGVAMKSVHDHLKVGGLALHVLPTRGDYNHGFYNIHSTFFRDLADANGYEIVDLLYIPDHDGQNRAIAKNPNMKPVMIDIRDTDDARREKKYAHSVLQLDAKSRPLRAMQRLYRMVRPRPANAALSSATSNIGAAVDFSQGPSSPGLKSRIRGLFSEHRVPGDHVFAALRKTNDAPFVFPQQGMYR